MSKTTRCFGGVALAFVILGVVIWKLIPAPSVQDPEANTKAQIVLPKRTPQQKMGDDFLESYASEATTGQQDIQVFYDYLTNVFLLIKNRDSAQYAINEDLSEFLLGKNSDRAALVSQNSHIFDKEKRIIDRWGTPIHIHTISHNNFELRSGGPDQKLFTEDDVSWPQK
ncbi:hypothetical protein N9F50_01490 [Akkermansiaceae bacterium]|nr:hypothetical protein [Akkermansiaceae bacterium]